MRAYDVDGVRRASLAARGEGGQHQPASVCMRSCCRQFATASGLGHSRHLTCCRAHQQKLAAWGAAGREPACMHTEVLCSWAATMPTSPL